MQETWVCSLCREDPLKEGMATHSSILAWKIPKTEESTGSTGSQKVRPDWARTHKLQQSRFFCWQLSPKIMKYFHHFPVAKWRGAQWIGSEATPINVQSRKILSPPKAEGSPHGKWSLTQKPHKQDAVKSNLLIPKRSQGWSTEQT